MDIVANVPRIPSPGETLLADGSSRGGGGKGANQAVAASRAGGALTAFVGAIGDDADGRQLRDLLASDGINVTGLSVVDEPSGMALISVADDAENTIVVVAGANGALTDLTAEQRDIVAAADVIAAQLEVPTELVIAAAETRHDGAILVLNGAPSAALANQETADRVLPLIDVLIVNEHELVDIARIDDQNAAIAALTAKVPALVVTLGAKGSIIAVGDDRREVPAFTANAVDTTGAGDTFCGVLAAHLPQDDLTIDALAHAARVGAAASAIAVTRVGAQAAVPSVAEVSSLLSES